MAGYVCEWRGATLPGIYPRCLSIPHEGASDKHRGYFPVYFLKPLFVARTTPIGLPSCFVGIVTNIRRASFGRTELCGRRNAEKVRVRERPACAILISLSGVAVAPIPEIEEWSGLNGSRRRNDISPFPFLLVRWEPFARATSV